MDVTHLDDEALYLIFQILNNKLDRKSFGLTCHRFLDIQSLSLKCLNLSRHFDSIPLENLLKRFRNLHTLSLNQSVSDYDVSKLETYGFKIQSLSLSYCSNVSDVGLTSVASGCPLLSVICLANSSVTNNGLEILTKSCKGLVEVNLAYCKRISDRGIECMFQNCRKIRALDISWCSNISGVGFQGCSSTLAFLKASYCDFQTTGLNEIISGGGLEYLNLSYHSKYMELGPATIGLGFVANLRILDFQMCDFVEDNVIISISKGCPLLEEWNLINCDKIGISGWESIGLHCQNLSIIYVHGCDNFCDQGLLSLGNGCKRLTEIYMTYCIGITPSGRGLFKIRRADVKIKEIGGSTSFPFWRFTWPLTRYLLY